MKQIKRIGALLLLLTLLPLNNITYAAQTIRIQLDGTTLTTDVAPVIVEDRTLVPMRAIFEALGYQVTWNEGNQTVTGTKEGNRLILQLGSNVMYKNTAALSLDVAPQIINSRTMVPLRAIAEATGATVTWDDAQRLINIRTDAQDTNGVFDSVVMITTNTSQGSGFIYNSNGLIVTNCHVIEDATVIAITFSDGRVYMEDITVAGYDISRDMAILRVNLTGLPALPIGDINQVRVGDAVVAIGAPQGARNTVTTGQVTNITPNYIVSDAVIDHGNSGGVLLNGKGEVIGIPSFSASNSTNTYYLSQRSDFLQTMNHSGQTPLPDFRASIEQTTPPQHFNVSQEGSQVFLDWEMLNDVDHYIIYQCDTENGIYKPIANPATKTDTWYWNYPHCFGMSFSGHGTYHKYFKVASVKDGHRSALSKPIEIDLKY